MMTTTDGHHVSRGASTFEAATGSRTDIQLPVSVAPSIWIESLDGMATEATLHRWIAQPRFQTRLSERLRRRHGLAPVDDLPERDTIDQALCRLDADTLPICVRAAGVIVHANALVREIQAPRVAALKQRLGADLYALALAQREHGSADDGVRDDLEAFEARLAHDGKRCLRAWGEAQPAALRAWLRLSWFGQLADDSADTDGSAGVTDNAVKIARLAMAHVQSCAKAQIADGAVDPHGSHST